MKKIKLISTICILLTLCLTLAVVSYAWLKREWNPGFKGENLKVQSSTTLAIKFNGTSTETLSLKDVTDFPDTFVFKQVSNLTGKDDHFFGVDNSKGDHENLPVVYIAPGSAEANGYIEATFNIISTAEANQRQYVFISGDSYIQVPDYVAESLDYEQINKHEELIDSIRVALVINEDTDEEKIVGIKLKNEAHTGITPERNGDGTYLAVGKNAVSGIKINNTEIVETTDKFKTLDYYKRSADADFGKDKMLFELPSSEDSPNGVPVTLRIWLEGTAAGCDEDIAGLDFDINIIFEGEIVDEAAAAGGNA